MEAHRIVWHVESSMINEQFADEEMRHQEVEAKDVYYDRPPSLPSQMRLMLNVSRRQDVNLKCFACTIYLTRLLGVQNTVMKDHFASYQG